MPRLSSRVHSIAWPDLCHPTDCSRWLISSYFKINWVLRARKFVVFVRPGIFFAIGDTVGPRPFGAPLTELNRRGNGGQFVGATYGPAAGSRTYVEALETQSARHIKPLHWYIAARLVIEGGFRPEEITPRPPLDIEVVGRGAERRNRLKYEPSAGIAGEQTILGGVKTKQVDVTVSKQGDRPLRRG